MNKKISILTPCYNGDKFIFRLFDSLLLQTYKNFEVILVDDGSTDNTRELCNKYKSLFNEEGIAFIYIYQDNAGQAAAVNNGLKYVTGDYLYWADADDWVESNILEVLSNELYNSDYKSVRCKATTYDEKTLQKTGLLEPKNKAQEDVFLDYLLVGKNTPCYIGVMMFDFSYFKEMNRGLDIYISNIGQNWQLTLPVLYKQKSKYLDLALYNYLVRENSHSHNRLTIEKQKNKIINQEKTLNFILDKLVEDEKEKRNYQKLLRKKYKIIKLKILIKQLFPFLNRGN